MNGDIENHTSLLIDAKHDGKNNLSYSSINTQDEVLQRSPSFNPANRVVLSWSNVNVFVKPKKKLLSRFVKSTYDVNEKKQLLFNVTGQVKPGHLTAIMGASGAGKTTLLNVLTNRNLRLLDVDGGVLVNGQNVGKNIVRLSAYVQQDDLFIGTLTVREHLTFQALLRMDSHLSYQDRMRRVEEVLVELGLYKCADTKIGITGQVKGISGGEAKRLAFAAEVLTNPALMFCDEPTSGLDSFMALSIVSVLRDMAAGGRTLICTIHQPSSEVFELFDHLILLAEGRVAFRGRASKALAFFDSVGLKCPINYNPADFYIRNLAIAPGNEQQSRDKITVICDKFAKEYLPHQVSLSTGPSFTDQDVTPKQKYKASWCSQFRTVMWRSWISLTRDPILFKVRLLQSILIGLMFGLVYLQQSKDQKGVMNINGALFILLMNTTFQNMYCVINSFMYEKAIFMREHENGMYRTDVYFLCKTICEAPILFFMTVLYISIVYWMIGLNPSVTAFLLCLGILILVANTAASFGYFISCISGSLNVALTIATPLIMPLVLFGGFYLHADSVPVYFIWLKYVSWFYYGNEILAVNQWKGVTNITCYTAGCAQDGDHVLKTLDFREENVPRDILAIVAIMVFFRLLAYVSLALKARSKS